MLLYLFLYMLFMVPSSPSDVIDAKSAAFAQGWDRFQRLFSRQR